MVLPMVKILILDNVHFQNSANLVWDFIGSRVTGYTLEYYTDSDHSMGANGAQQAIYNRIKTFVCESFNQACK